VAIAVPPVSRVNPIDRFGNMDKNHKLRESIAVGLVIGLLSFVAGAENYYSGMAHPPYSTSNEGLHQASFTLQKENAGIVFKDSTTVAPKN
jgi:hypothetical protein